MSKILDLVIDLNGLELPPPDKEKTSQELVAIVLHNIMYSYSKTGLKKSARIHFHKLIRRPHHLLVFLGVHLDFFELPGMLIDLTLSFHQMIQKVIQP